MTSSPATFPTLLDGIRVLDLSSGIAGGYCARVLADYGAQVILVEPPEGSPLRQAGPFPGGVPDPDRSGLFLFLSINKRGVVLDPADQAAREALVRQADIVITDGPLDVISRQPHQIVTSVTPFGNTGPYADRAGSDLVCFAMSGLVRDTPGNVDDLERQPPLRPGGRQGDFTAGLAAAYATTLALIERERTGLGQTVDLSEWETLTSFATYDALAYSYDPNGVYLKRSADRRITGGYPRTSLGVWPCKDGYVAIAIREQSHFLKFVQVMGNPPWAQDDRFMSMAARGENVQELNPLILEWLMQHTVAEIWQLALEHELPIAPCNDVQQLLSFDQFQARHLFVEVEHPDLGLIRIPRGPAAFSGTPWRIRRVGGQGERRKAKGEGSPEWESLSEGKGEHHVRSAHGTQSPSEDNLPVGSDPLRPSPFAFRPLPLAGIRVIEFASAAAAPFSTFWLAAMGAEVIKIESHEHIDYARRVPPFFEGIAGPERGAMFISKGLNKRSCTINLGHPKARDLVNRVIGLSNVVVENFSYRVAQRLGVTYQNLEAVRPGIILVSCSALGRSGPARRLPGYAENISAVGGLVALTGYPGARPGMPGGAWGDYLSGTALAAMTALAIFGQQRTGQGQHVDLAMAEAVASQVPEAIIGYQLNGTIPDRAGNRDDWAVPNGCFPCAGEDQWVAITITSEAEWRGLVRALGPALADPAFATVASRRTNEERLNERIASLTRPYSTGDLVERLQREGVAAGPVLNAPGRINDPHLQARGFYFTADHPECGPRLAMRPPFILGSHPELPFRPAPVIGQDNEYVFGELLGIGDEEFAELIGDGLIW